MISIDGSSSQPRCFFSVECMFNVQLNFSSLFLIFIARDYVSIKFDGDFIYILHWTGLW